MKPEASDIYQRFSKLLGVGRQGAHAGHPRQRRPARPGRARLRLRRARHRAVPHRAHVLRRGPHREGAAHDPRRQRGRPPRGTRTNCCRCSASDFYGVFKAHARRAGDHPHDRPAAARVPAEARRPDGRDRQARGHGRHGQGTRREEDAAAPRRAAPRVQPDARPPRRAPRASPTRRSPRCRRAPSSRRRASSRRKASRPSPR